MSPVFPDEWWHACTSRPRRNQVVKLVPLLTKLGLAVGHGEKAHTGLVLPDYGIRSR